MRFIIYGAGGIGGVVGARLVRAGMDAVLIARGEHLDALRTRGLSYESPGETWTIPVETAGHPREIDFRDGDVVFLAMKTQHTLDALHDLRAAAGDRIPVICCQNGVANERSALRRFRNVYAMLVMLPAQFMEPGRIQCHSRTRPGLLDLGCYPGGTDALAQDISERLEAANISSRADPKIMRLKYAKLLMNLHNGLEAVLPEGETADDILTMLRDEGRACFMAANIDWASEEDVRQRRDGVFDFGDIPGAGRVGGSSRQSLLRGTGDIETDYLNGEIVVLGRTHGIATPANAVIQRISNDFAVRKDRAATISADELRSLIAAEEND